MNRIIKAVSNSIYSAFPEAEIYTGYSPQGTEEGSFLVNAESVRKEQYLGKRRKLSVLVTVTYFPHDQYDTGEMHDIAETLEEVLDIIEFENKYKAHNVSWTESDHVLVFMSEYSVFLNSFEDEPLMLELTEEIHGK